MAVLNNREPVVVSLDDLKNGVDENILNDAFGSDSLGIIIVNGLPSEFAHLRSQVLQSSSKLASLPFEVLKNLESEESMWLTGWSCGKEKLAASGKSDFNKGSYYINCAFHKDPRLEGPPKELSDKFSEYKAYTIPNKWPSNKLEGLENFESNCKELCNFIIDVAELVALNCDRYIYKSQKDYESGFLERILKDSTTTKARLLHYYPNQGNPSSEDSWCGEHLDHSCLTGLTSALFLKESNGSIVPLDSSPDPAAGLYIRNRKNEIVKVNIPSNCLAFQSGSALEEVSKGSFKAVPHYVKGTSLPEIARNTLAVFCQPNLDEKVNDNENFAEYADRILKANH